MSTADPSCGQTTNEAPATPEDLAGCDGAHAGQGDCDAGLLRA
ncbi:MAG: hypothetical protein QOH95_668, partial [Gaiellaceae bacterium]|nr:hypothetical protein [Gaiellaceae bacterium]